MAHPANFSLMMVSDAVKVHEFKALVHEVCFIAETAGVQDEVTAAAAAA